MNKNYLNVLAGSAFALSTWSGMAAPIQKGDVPSAPNWVLHVDCDKVRPTAIGQYLLGELEKPEAQNKFAAFTAIFNFDPRQQLHGLTLYSTGNAPEDAVLLVYADVDPARLETLAKGAKDYHSAPYKQFIIHNWTDEKKSKKAGPQRRNYAALYGAKVVAFGQTESQVAKALDVLSKQTPGLDSVNLWPFPTNDQNYIQAFARKMDVTDGDPSAAIFRLSKMVRFQMGEALGNAKAVLTLSADSEEVASNLSSIANGLVALMKFQKAKPETAKLAEAMALKQEGADLVVTVNLAAANVIEMMKSDAARKTAEKN
jgi:hypothetical protein